MKKQIVTLLRKYISCALVVGGLVWLFLSLRDYEGASQADRYRMLCDAFTIPGVILIMVGALVWVSTQGALDGITYCVRFAIFSLIPGKRLERDEKYAEYVERKSSNRMKGYGFLFISGAITMAVAFVFMFLFNRAYQG